MKKALLLFALLAGASVGLAAAGPSWIATQSRVRVMCAFTTGGSFETKTTALRGSLTASASHPSYDGSLIVDLRRLDSGSEIRNDHMRYYYLEVDKLQGYDTATLSDIDLRGLSPTAPGKGMFTASLMLHGITKSVSGDVDVRQCEISRLG